MKKCYYDHKSILCEGCAHFAPAGPRAVTRDWAAEGCRRYGYSLTGQYPELADGCEGFQTPAQYAAEIERLEREKRNRNNKSKQPAL